MADQVGRVFYVIDADDRLFNKGLKNSKKQVQTFDKNATKSFKSVGGGFSKLGLGVAAFTGVFIIGINKSIKAASDLQEATNKFNTIFRGVGKEAQKVSNELVSAYGLSNRQSKELLASTGSLLTGFGFTADEALKLSGEVNRLAVDLASFTNAEGGAERVSRALNSALVGNTESLTTLDTKILDADINAKLFEKGQEKLTGTARLRARAEATLALVVEQNTLAQGDAIRTQGDYANLTRRLESRQEDLSATLGAKLLPALSEIKVAFLDSTSEGGFLTATFEAIGTALAKVVATITVVVRALDFLKSSNKSANDQFNIFNEELKKTGQRGAFLLEVAKAGGNVEKAIQNISLAARNGNDEQKSLFLTLAKAQQKAESQTSDSKKEIEALEKSVRQLTGGFTEQEKQQAIAAQKAQQRAKALSKEERKKFEALKKQSDSFLAQTRQIGESEVDEAERVRQEKLSKTDEFLKAGVISEKDAAKARVKINEEADKKILESRAQNTVKVTDAVAGGLGQVNQLVGMAAQNRQTEIDNETNARLLALQTQFEADKANIEATIVNTDDRNAALEALDQEKARAEDAINKEASIRKTKAARKAAKTQKDLSVAETLFKIPQAALSAFSSLAVIPIVGPILGGIAAAAATAFGFAQVALIQQQPLPQFAAGGLATGPSIFGEAGNELALPLDSDKGQNAIKSFAEGVKNVLQPVGATTSEAGTLSSGFTKIIVNIGSQRLFADVENAIGNREIIIRDSDLATV